MSATAQRTEASRETPEASPASCNLESAIDTLLSAAADSARSGYVIRAVDVRKVYRMGDSETHALRGVTLDIRRGEYLSIMGPSGSGKSTFFNMIGGLDKPSAGKVYIDQVDIAQLDPYELAWLRCRKVGYIFQSFNLIQVMSCIENVMLPMAFAGRNSEEAREKAMEILELVGLGDRALHKPAEMSGGQQQRVAVARALANAPDILLADEPTANLDLKTGKEIIDLFCRLRDKLGVTVISATHDLKMLKASDRIAWIDDGRLTRLSTPAELNIDVEEIHSSTITP
jgi:putative ABC transport system ATP-binding protein